VLGRFRKAVIFCDLALWKPLRQRRCVGHGSGFPGLPWAFSYLAMQEAVID
jgi:hypothetical protein